MKRVLVTGGAGFIAHHLISQILQHTDWEVVTLDRLDFSGNLNRLQDILTHENRSRVKVVFHDLKASINPMIAADIGKVDYILHLAAGSHVDRSIEYPMEFVMDNVVATCNILDFARGLDSIERFVYFSTDEVFGPAPFGVNYDEYDRYNSTNPYSATKAGGEELAVAFENTYGLPVYITHTMNVFGQRQHPEKFIPMCIKRIRDGDPITIHCDESKTIPGSRHYIHAEDVSDAVLFLLSQEEVTEDTCPKFNIVGAEELDNLQLAQIIADVQGKELIYNMVDFHSSRPGHDLRYALSGKKMSRMGWEPKNIRDRIREVVEWTLINDRWIQL
jgi:dTDP-glucose 4,6-dehydratase